MRLPALLAALPLAACTIGPMVDYHALRDPQRSDSWLPYALTDTVVAIGVGNALETPPRIELGGTVKCLEAECDRPLAALAIPVDFDGERLALAPRSHGLTSTTISASYFPNSLRIQVLTVEAKDHRLEAIKAAGAIIAGGAKMFAGGVRSAIVDDNAVLQLPVMLPLGDARAAVAPTPLPGNPDWTYTAAFAGTEPAAAGFIPRARHGEIHGALLTSTCRTLRLVLSHGGDSPAEAVIAVRVADPEWLVAIPFPGKGTMTLHPLCGADTRAQPATQDGVDVLAQEAVAQMSALKK